MLESCDIGGMKSRKFDVETATHMLKKGYRWMDMRIFLLVAWEVYVYVCVCVLFLYRHTSLIVKEMQKD